MEAILAHINMTMVILILIHDSSDRDLDISCDNHEHASNQNQNHDRNIPTIHNGDCCNGSNGLQDKNGNGDTNEKNGIHVKY